MVDVPRSSALELLKANLGLGLRMARLLEEARRRWLATGEQLLCQDLDETEIELAQLRDAAQWSALAALPSRAGWRMLNRDVATWQVTAQTALSQQMALWAGAQQVLAQWQRESAQAFTTARNTMPLQAGLQALWQTSAQPASMSPRFISPAADGDMRGGLDGAPIESDGVVPDSQGARPVV